MIIENKIINIFCITDKSCNLFDVESISFVDQDKFHIFVPRLVVLT